MILKSIFLHIDETQTVTDTQGQGVMAMNGFSTPPRSPEQKSLIQIQFND